jgi:hypothetical protein
MKLSSCAVVMCAIFGLTTLTGCRDDDPMEEAAENIEDAGENIGEGFRRGADRTGYRIEDAWDRAGDNLERAGERIERGAERTGDRMEDAWDDVRNPR